MPGELYELEVAFTCTDPGPFHALLEAETRNQQVIKIPVNAHALVPDVKVDQGTLQFGQVHIGGSCRLPLTLHNSTPVPALMALDLSAYPCFELTLPKENWNMNEYEDCPLKRAGRDSDSFSACSTRCSKRYCAIQSKEHYAS